MAEATINLVLKPIDKLDKIYDLLEKDPKLGADSTINKEKESNSQKVGYNLSNAETKKLKGK